ncbi:MAG: IclR family transcriptional regulator C-terminal domain-containing protein [Cytophagales bacterium]|nr:IclR family transcriptional regulator C-terminal domain-containing protein [Cytophagales bacterium]
MATQSRGIQSIEVGGKLLQALADAGRALALKDLALAAKMTPAKAHPYLVSFSKLGLIEQDADTGRYGLGAFGVQLGLIGLQQIDPVRLASAMLSDLALRAQHTVAIAVWGTQGPTIIKTEAGPESIYVNIRLGTTISVQGTASGKLFAALLPTATAKGIAGSAWRDPAFQKELSVIRKKNISVVRDSVVRGVSAIATPVFDAFGHIVLALVVIGPSATLDLKANGVPTQVLAQAASSLSKRLGAASEK